MSLTLAFRDGRKMPIYVDAEIDDSGMDVYERAVYLTIARRSGKGSTFYESVANMANRLGIGTTKAREALRNLRSYGVIVREERAGETSVYVLTDRTSGWKLPPPRPPLEPQRQPLPHPNATRWGTPTPGVAEVPPSEGPPEDLKPLSTSSTRAPKQKVSPKEEQRAGQVQELVDIWNEHRGTLASVTSISPERQRKITRFIGLCDSFDAAKDIFTRATKFAARDDYWIKSKKYGLDNMFSKDKIFQKAESYEAQEAPTSTACSLGDRVRFTSVMGRVEEGQITGLTDKQAAIRQDRDGRVVRAPLGSIKEVL